VVSQTNAGRQAGRNTGHHGRSRIIKPAAYDPEQAN